MKISCKFLAIMIALLNVLIAIIIICEIKYGEKDLDIHFECMDHSIKGDSGKIVAEIYYDKPVIPNNTNSAMRINALFEQRYSYWLNGYSMENFMRNIRIWREALVDEAVEHQPFKNVIDFEIVFLQKSF